MWSIVRSQPLLATTSSAAFPRRAILERIVLAAASTTAPRSFSTGKHKKFTPRRRPSANYRPTKARGDHYKFGGFTFGSGKDQEVIPLDGHYKPTRLQRQGLDGYDDDSSDNEDGDEWEREFGPRLGDQYRAMARQRNSPRRTVEDELSMMDYLTAEEGSTEELAFERRALSEECSSDQEREEFLKSVEDLVERESIDELDWEPDEPLGGVDPNAEKKPLTNDDYNPYDPERGINPNQKAFGEWGELLVRVDRNIKLWRGGRIQSYRALVIGGNLNGCAGFGVGKAPDARGAVIAASRKCKRNIFFIDRYQTNSLTRDLVGKHNSCKVVLRATNKGLRGNLLCQEILKYFGVCNATAKCTQGNRSQFNVVYATFKAICTHESMEDIAHKRGRRLVSLDRGRKLLG